MGEHYEFFNNRAEFPLQILEVNCIQAGGNVYLC